MGFGLWLIEHLVIWVLFLPMNHLGLRLEIEQKELNSKIDNHERLGSLIRGWAHLAFTYQHPLWWIRCHHTPWSIHAWEIEIRVWKRFPINQDESSWANHDHEVRMSWAWWSDDLGLHAFTPSSACSRTRRRLWNDRIHLRPRFHHRLLQLQSKRVLVCGHH
jgi:hypothetical protein